MDDIDAMSVVSRVSSLVRKLVRQYGEDSVDQVEDQAHYAVSDVCDALRAEAEAGTAAGSDAEHAP